LGLRSRVTTPRQTRYTFTCAVRQAASPLRRWDIPDLAAAGAPISHRRPVVRRLELANNVALAEDGVCDIELVSAYNK
jgi:hypothetical protein